MVIIKPNLTLTKFKKKVWKPWIHQTTIHLILNVSALLNITAAPNNGTHGALDHLLSHPPMLQYESTHHAESCTGLPHACDCQVRAFDVCLFKGITCTFVDF